MLATLRAERLPGRWALIFVDIAMALVREAALHVIEVALVKELPGTGWRGKPVR